MYSRNSNKPYISLSVVARNDDYGGNFLHRMQLFMDNQIYFWNKYALNAELIIVEWNPPLDKPRLNDVLRWPDRLQYGVIRIVEVPQEIHAAFPNAGRTPVFEYIAKNVGMRRSRGEYIVATNPDLLYSEELFSFFAEKKLNPQMFYRIDKYDVGQLEIPRELSQEETLKLCASNITMVGNRYGAAILKNENPLGLRNIHRMLTRYKNLVTHFPHTPPYTNTSGDFFLMHSKYWHMLRGYPELKSHSLIDGYICYMAASSGLRQVVLNDLSDKLRIYHPEHHHERSGNRPWTDLGTYKRRCFKMIRTKTPWIANDENWGLANYDLPEYRVI